MDHSVSVLSFKYFIVGGLIETKRNFLLFGRPSMNCFVSAAGTAFLYGGLLATITKYDSEQRTSVLNN